MWRGGGKAEQRVRPYAHPFKELRGLTRKWNKLIHSTQEQANNWIASGLVGSNCHAGGHDGQGRIQGADAQVHGHTYNLTGKFCWVWHLPEWSEASCRDLVALPLDTSCIFSRPYPYMAAFPWHLYFSNSIHSYSFLSHPRQVFEPNHSSSLTSSSSLNACHTLKWIYKAHNHNLVFPDTSYVYMPPLLN